MPIEADTQFLDEQETAHTEYLEKLRNEALARFSQINGPSSLHQFHAHIGRNNNTFVDAVRTQFGSPQEFIARWLDGLREHLIAYSQRPRWPRARKNTEQILVEVFRDPILKDYTYRFLERNFYRNFHARIRAKPDEILWQLWFGSGQLVWGLIISPALRLGAWTNDKSQMRRESYEYWTIGHVLETGLIDPEQADPIRFFSINEFFAFYRSVLTRVSNSVYEKGIAAKYVDYVMQSTDPAGEPLLIPELRYAGKEREHQYRLDYTVLNPYSMSMTGFEISPASTHMAISGIRSKTQVELNDGLSKQWNKEMDKRNSYFKTYGISTETFTDDALKDLEACFERIRIALRERPERRVTIDNAESALEETCAQLGL